MMRGIKKIFALAILLVVLVPVSLLASFEFDPRELYNPMAIINVVIVLMAAACLIWALKILSLVKGGLMSKSWQMFGLGFGFLIIAQLVSLGQRAGLYVIPDFINPAIYLLMVVAWLYGLYQTRKVLG
jgi:hypothetical protein